MNIPQKDTLGLVNDQGLIAAVKENARKS